VLALEGKRILDLTHYPPGAFCTMILGDLGAEVVKVQGLPEVTERGIDPQMVLKGDEAEKKAAFDALNRNKKSIGLNLKTESGRQVFNRLVKTGDVIVEGFRPGVVKRLGIDYESVKSINPSIIYCSLSGYGQDGPYSKLPGHDVNYISLAGALNLIGTHDEPPIIPLNLLGDFAGASLHGAIGILAALMARDKTGKGQHVDIAYLDGVIALLTWFATDYFSNGIVRGRGETFLQGAYPYYGVYKTMDGKYITIGCGEPWFWTNLCRALDKEEYIPYHSVLPDHHLYKPEGSKWEEISLWLKQIFLTRTADEWFEFLTKKDVPVGKVYTFDEVFRDPQVLHRQMVVEIDHPSLGKVKQVGIAIKLSETPGRVRSFSPRFGEHTEEILLELGYTLDDITKLKEEAAIGYPEKK
jgi:crotonobetainyl-CoA:carnitine CoA-transferase CaiB-like acyl-CoA transferase